MEDKNQNGVIDQGAGEGYEEFSERYGDADIGFAANGVTFGAVNSRLEEPEIVNHYYINIRFKNPVETEAIESEVSSYIYANNIPLVWLDDEQGTVMNAVNRILGAGWNEQEVTEDEAVRLFNRTMQGLRMTGRSGDPARTGYYTLPEFVTRKAGYCFEVAQFGFWFFSELKINSMSTWTFLTPTLLHTIIKITSSNNFVDYSKVSSKYNVPPNNWHLQSPIQSIGYYHSTQAIRQEKANGGDYTYLFEKAAIYDKYSIEAMVLLIYAYNKKSHEEIIALGEYLLQNIELSEIINSKDTGQAFVKDNLKIILLSLAKSYSLTQNQRKFDETQTILQQFR
jgi:hypothetical protein